MNIETIRDYYGRELSSSADLRTDACCDLATTPQYVRDALTRIDDEVLARYYGCGLVAPLELNGLTILDLGCGSGRDAFILAQLVGGEGKVIGIDATCEQLDIARKHEGYQAKAFGYAAPNTTFIEGRIEELDLLDIASNSVDVIVSNCVVNLSSDKSAVLDQVWRALKPGGEFYFSDIYADRRLPADLRLDPILLGECLAGALYWQDFLTVAKRSGFADPRLVEDRPLTIGDSDVRGKLGLASFFSATYRLFKIPELETACEDYGQAVIYNGSIEYAPDLFVLDKHHRIEAGKVFPVCGNTYQMLKQSRFEPHFEFIGDFNRHFGLFRGCGAELPFSVSSGGIGTVQGCC